MISVKRKTPTPSLIFTVSVNLEAVLNLTQAHVGLLLWVPPQTPLKKKILPKVWSSYVHAKRVTRNWKTQSEQPSLQYCSYI